MRIIAIPCLALSLAFGQNLTPSSIPLSALNVGVVDPSLNVPEAPVAAALQQGLGGQILPARSPKFAFTNNSVFASASADTSKTLMKLFASGMSKILNANQQGARWNLYYNAIECKQGTDNLYHTIYAVIPVFEVLPNAAQGISDTVYITLGEALRLQITTHTAIDVSTTMPQQVAMEPALNPGLSPKSFAQMMQDLLKRTTKFFVLQ